MDKQRMLVIGARGFLGMYAAQAAAGTDAFEIIRGNRSNPEQPGSTAVDITDASGVERTFHLTRPDCVLLLAAMSDIDRCEASPAEAFAVNAHGAENVANACARGNARLLFTSSAAVFDGSKHGYGEEDATCPLSVYGETKVLAEKAVTGLLPSAIVLRIALVLGFAHKNGTNAMLDSVMGKWKAGEPVYFPTPEERNPIDATSLSTMMVALLARPSVGGTYHIGASDSISRYELGKRLAERAGVSAELVRPQHDPIPGRAPRGEDHFLLTAKIRNVYKVEIPSSSQVIERCFS
ncbi:MAG: NAD(P)-dependent oxidoreductase [Acidobacteriaceae bacterium]